MEIVDKINLHWDVVLRHNLRCLDDRVQNSCCNFALFPWKLLEFVWTVLALVWQRTSISVTWTGTLGAVPLKYSTIRSCALVFILSFVILKQETVQSTKNDFNSLNGRHLFAGVGQVSSLLNGHLKICSSSSICSWNSISVRRQNWHITRLLLSVWKTVTRCSTSSKLDDVFNLFVKWFSRWGSNSQPRHCSELFYKYHALTDCATGEL